MSTMDTITLVANLSLTFSFLVALVFGISQVTTARKDRKERLTLDTLKSFQSREFSELLIYVYNSNLPATLSEWLKLPATEKVSLLQFSQTMESLGIAVAERYINIELVEKTIGSVVTVSWEKLKPWILDAREQQPDPYLNEYFQWMAEQLSGQMEKKPRKPFYKMKIK
jgi:hypothetical protein